MTEEGDLGELEADDPAMREAERIEEEQRPDPITERWAPLTMEALTAKPKPRDWLLVRQRADLRGIAPNAPEGRPEGVLPRGKLGIFAGAGASGKTASLCRLALAVATGRTWLGDWEVPKNAAGRVLLALGEEDGEEIARRMYRAAKSLRLEGPALELAVSRIVTVPLMGRSAGIIDDDWRATKALDGLRSKLREDAGEEGWALLVFDPFARFAPMDAEKDQVGATRMLSAFESLTEAPGNPTVIVAHHTSQAARNEAGEARATDVRGVTAITDNARWVASVQRESFGSPEDDDRPVRLRVSVTKSNYAKTPPAMWCAFDEWGAVREENFEETEQREKLERAAEDTKQSKSKKPKPNPFADMDAG